MASSFIQKLPPLANDRYSNLYTPISGTSGIVSTATFIARIDLPTASLVWLAQCNAPKIDPNVWSLPRYITVSGKQVWVSPSNSVVAKICTGCKGDLNITARELDSGATLWTYTFPIPHAAPWAEESPAWPGAQTEEISAFLCDDAHHLVVCIFRQTRRAMMCAPSLGIDVTTLPPQACQLDVTCLDARTGKTKWLNSFQDTKVGIRERDQFRGLWSNGSCVGHLAFGTGTQSILYESDRTLGYPVKIADTTLIPWHSRREAGIVWMDDSGLLQQECRVPASGVKKTCLWVTDGGLALQVNDQSLWWLGHECHPRWQTRSKPYIYNVHCRDGTDVYVGTDGAGGRLLAFNAQSGTETIKVRPKYGGAANTMQVAGRNLLFAVLGTSRGRSGTSHLFEISMTNGNCSQGMECNQLLGTWDQGAICRAGTGGSQVAVVQATS